MQVGLRVAREVKVYDHVDRHDVDTASEKISAHQTARVAVFKVMINPTVSFTTYLLRSLWSIRE